MSAGRNPADLPAAIVRVSDLAFDAAFLATEMEALSERAARLVGELIAAVPAEQRPASLFRPHDATEPATDFPELEADHLEADAEPPEFERPPEDDIRGMSDGIGR